MAAKVDNEGNAAKSLTPQETNSPLLGLYALINALGYLAIALGILGMDLAEMGLSKSLMAAGAALPVAGYALAGIVLLAFGDRIAAKLIFQDGHAGEAPMGVTPRESQALAFSVVGIYLIATTLPSLGSLLWLIAYQAREGGADFARASLESAKMNTVQVGVKLAVGIGLFLGARSLSSLWFFLQKVRGPKLLDQ